MCWTVYTAVFIYSVETGCHSELVGHGIGGVIGSVSVSARQRNYVNSCNLLGEAKGCSLPSGGDDVELCASVVFVSHASGRCANEVQCDI